MQLEIYNYVANTEVYVFWDALLAPFHSTPLTTFRDQLKECNGGPGLPRTRLDKKARVQYHHSYTAVTYPLTRSSTP